VPKRLPEPQTVLEALETLEAGTQYNAIITDRLSKMRKENLVIPKK